MPLQITAGHAAHRLSKGTFTIGSVAWDERAIPRFAELAEAVHAHDSRIFVQLFAPGARDRGTDHIDHFHELWSPSAIPSAGDGEIPVAMDQDQIDEVVSAFAASAANVKAGGLDGVEIHAAYSSSLVGYFLNPAYNRRGDGYGGSPAQRCRFPIEVGGAIRERVGDDFTIGIRVSFEEFTGDAGITQAQAEIQLDTMAGAGIFDFFDISGGSYATLHFGVASMTVEDGYMIPFGRRAKEIVGDRANGHAALSSASALRGPGRATPVVPLAGMIASILIGGVVLVEVILSWGGVAQYGATVIIQNDYPAIQSFVFVAAISVFVFLLVDLLHVLINPRVTL